MGSDDTPPDAMPARGDHAPTDARWFHEWRREVTQTLRDLAIRLSGIDNRLSEGTATIDKHDGQVLELAAAVAEHHRRLSHQEAAEARRVEREELWRRAAKERSQTIVARSIRAAVVGAAGSAGAMAVGVSLYLLVLWARAGAPGASVPGVTPATIPAPPPAKGTP